MTVSAKSQALSVLAYLYSHSNSCKSLTVPPICKINALQVIFLNIQISAAQSFVLIIQATVREL